MRRHGGVVLSADRLGAAVARLEALGCVVRSAAEIEPGKFAAQVDAPSLESGIAVAYAVAREEISWSPQPLLAVG